MLAARPAVYSFVFVLLLLSISASARATVIPPWAPICCDEMPVACRPTACKDSFDCSEGCLKRNGARTFPCQLKQPADFERLLTNSAAAVEYFKSYGVRHIESISRQAHVSGACEISASTTSKLDIRGKTYLFRGPHLAVRPRGEVSIRYPVQNIPAFTRAVDAAEGDPAVRAVQERVKARVITQTFELNTWGRTVGVRHVYRLSFGPSCGPGDMGFYYEWDIEKGRGWLKFYKFPVDLLVGQSGFEEIDRLEKMPEFQGFKADGRDNDCLIVESIDARGKFGVPDRRAPEVELWKPGKGLRLIVR